MKTKSANTMAVVVGCITFALLLGCAKSDPASAEISRIRAAIAAHQIVMGMIMDDLVAAKGKPANVHQETVAGHRVETAFMEGGAIVELTDGKVSKISEPTTTVKK